jgi:flagellar protein FlaG
MITTTPIDGLGNPSAASRKAAAFQLPSVQLPPLTPESRAQETERSLAPPEDRVTVSPTAAARQEAPEPIVEPVSQEEIMARLQKIVESLAEHSASVRFTVDRENDLVIVKVISPTSGEIIRQIPPDEMIHAYKALGDLRGALFSDVT